MIRQAAELLILARGTRAIACCFSIVSSLVVVVPCYNGPTLLCVSAPDSFCSSAPSAPRSFLFFSFARLPPSVLLPFPKPNNHILYEEQGTYYFPSGSTHSGLAQFDQTLEADRVEATHTVRFLLLLLLPGMRVSSFPYFTSDLVRCLWCRVGR